MRTRRTVRQFIFAIVVQPIFPFLQWLGRVSGIFTEAKTVEGPHRRQPFRIGVLTSLISLPEVEKHLTQQGFVKNPIAYPDPGQLLSMRRLDDASPDTQFHIRIFRDAEVRGHYEFTPEDHPFAHLNETLFEARTADFHRWMGDYLEHEKG